MDLLDACHRPRLVMTTPGPGSLRPAGASIPVPRAFPLDMGPSLPRLGLRPRRSLSHFAVRLPARLGGPRRGGATLGLLLAAATAAVLAAPLAHHGAGAGASHQHPTDPPAAHRPLADFAHQAPPALPPASAVPAPPPPDVAGAPPLRRHELFGFAPYWTLDLSPGFDLRSLSTIAYFAVDAGPDGTIQQSGDGWTGYSSQALATLVTRAHSSGVRVVLTVKNFDDAQIHTLVSDPAAADRLAQQLIAAIRAKNMDGANLDVEATGGADRAGYATFVTRVARTLHAANPHWQVTVDTYAGSAANPDGFFDVAAMAPAVDAFFVMAYDMYGDGNRAQPNAPLDNYSPNDTTAMAAYTAAVPASKLLLGTPFYGYDWRVDADKPNAAALGDPSPTTYAEIVGAAHQPQWDAKGSVPFTTYQAGDGSWHQTYYDDPRSLAMKAQLVNRFRLRGLGIWALGMDGNDPAMMAALLGHAPPLKAQPAGSGATPAPSASQPSGSSAPTAGTPSGGSHSSPTPTPKSSPTPTPSPSDSGAPAPTAPPPPSLTPPPLPSAPVAP
jgi:spore germination protein YaaH